MKGLTKDESGWVVSTGWGRGGSVGNADEFGLDRVRTTITILAKHLVMSQALG